MPSVSNTARIGPPAMMPVPVGAARRNTLPAPWWPMTSWWSVRPSRSGTLMRLRFAASVAFRIASGTSRALPWPKPTRPFWSPTTTSAAKPKRRPPFTTLATRLMWTSLSVNSLSRSSRRWGSRAISLCHVIDPTGSLSGVSEVQSAFACRLGQGFHPAVIEIAAAVEYHVLDALFLGALRDQLADRLGRVDAGAGLHAFARRLLDRRSRRERDALVVVDHLGIDVLGRAEHGEPLALARGAAQRAADAALAAHNSVAELGYQAAPLLLLAFLAEDAFAGIFDALALVRLRRSIIADLGGDLADLLPVAAGDHDFDRPWRRNGDAFGDQIDDVVAIAERDLQVLALHRGAIADAVDLEPLLETFGDAGDQIGDQRARRAPLRAGALGFETRIDLDLAAVKLHGDVVVQHHLQGALGTFDLDRLALDIGGDAGGDGDWFFADTGHQNTVHRISPPTLASRASWSAMTPFGVETMATPRPLLMRGRFFTEV